MAPNPRYPASKVYMISSTDPVEELLGCTSKRAKHMETKGHKFTVVTST